MLENIDLKRMFRFELDKPARDKNGDVIREEDSEGMFRLVTRAEVVVDKAITRAERGDMYALKLIVDLIEPKQLRIAVAAAVTVEHGLNPALQAIIDKLLVTNTVNVVQSNAISSPTGYPKNEISKGGGKNSTTDAKTNSP